MTMKWEGEDNDSEGNFYERSRDFVNSYVDKGKEKYNDVKDSLRRFDGIKTELTGAITSIIPYSVDQVITGEGSPRDIAVGHLLMAYGASNREKEVLEGLEEKSIEPDLLDKTGQKLQKYGFVIGTGSATGNFVGLDYWESAGGVIAGWLTTAAGAGIEIMHTIPKEKEYYEGLEEKNKELKEENQKLKNQVEAAKEMLDEEKKGSLEEVRKELEGK